jgi:hypothetical protein
MRAAGSEVEDFTRVELMTGDDVRLAGHATSDVVHLLAELIENATTFSPPDTPVRTMAGGPRRPAAQLPAPDGWPPPAS